MPPSFPRRLPSRTTLVTASPDLAGRLLLEQLCGVQLVPQAIGYRGPMITRSETPSSRQKTPITALVAALIDNRDRQLVR